MRNLQDSVLRPLLTYDRETVELAEGWHLRLSCLTMKTAARCSFQSIRHKAEAGLVRKAESALTVEETMESVRNMKSSQGDKAAKSLAHIGNMTTYIRL